MISHWAVRAGSTMAVAATVHAALNSRLMRRPSSRPPAPAVDVSVLVPARDEADTIADCLAALRALDGGRRIEILVLDDESSDSTGMIARNAAGTDARVRVLEGTAPPAGWLGKPHACAQLAAAARASSEVLVFVDADVHLEPAAVAAALDLMARHDLDLVSPYPRQVAESAAERIVQPLLQWSWLSFLPLRVAERSRRSSMSAANGQFLAVRRAVYERAGGHGAVRDRVIDDVALLRAVKAVGGTGGVVDGTQLASCRMYRSWPQLRDGYAKSLHVAFGSAPGAAAVIGVLGLAYLLPPAAMLAGSRAGAVGYLAGVAGRIVTARATGGRTWPDPLAQPVSVAALAGLVARSYADRRRGALRWRGRPLAGAR